MFDYSLDNIKPFGSLFEHRVLKNLELGRVALKITTGVNRWNLRTASAKLKASLGDRRTRYDHDHVSFPCLQSILRGLSEGKAKSHRLGGSRERGSSGKLRARGKAESEGETES